MTFDYIALNKSNSKVEGEVSAENLQLARKRLHDMGLTVLAINERKGDKTDEKTETVDEKKDYISFEFKGIDKKGKEIVGTIDSKDSLQAYVRLKNEFFFDVVYLFDLDASEMEREKQKKEWVKELQKKYELAGFAVPKEEKKEESDLEDSGQANMKKLELMRNQVEEMLVQIKSVLQKVKNDPEKRADLAQIKILMGELERVKMSNNIKHIRGVADRILDIAEDLFREQEEYEFVVQQKKNLDSPNLDKIEQQNYQEAVEIKGISGALGQAFGLFNKYTGRLGKVSQKNKNIKTGLKDSLKKTPFKKQVLLKEDDLLEKTQSDLRGMFKENLLFVLKFWEKGVSQKTAFSNLITICKPFFKRKNPAKQDFEKVFIELNLFLGWLICFYLIYFYVGALVLQKNIPFLRDFFYKTIMSEFLIVLFFAFFLFHLLINLKIKFLRQSFVGGLVLFLFGSFVVLLYSLNF